MMDKHVEGWTAFHAPGLVPLAASRIATEEGVTIHHQSLLTTSTMDKSTWTGIKTYIIPTPLKQELPSKEISAQTPLSRVFACVAGAGSIASTDDGLVRMDFLARRRGFEMQFQMMGCENALHYLPTATTHRMGGIVVSGKTGRELMMVGALVCVLAKQLENTDVFDLIVSAKGLAPGMIVLAKELENKFASDLTICVKEAAS
jgi:hypothetical protein